MDGKQIFAGIEVADHEVRLVIGEFFNTRFNIIKVERVPCDGITYNEVINPEAVTAAVVTAAWNAIYNAAVSAWNAIVDTVTSVWNTIQSVIDAGVASVTEKWDRLKSIFSSPIQAVVNFVKGGDSDAASKSGVDISENAQGGIYRRGAFLTTFAEDSAEAAIPLDGSARAVALWRQAGQMLGTMPGASASAVPVALPGGSSSSNVTIDFNPTINVSGNADAGVLPMIRAALAEQKAQFEKELPDMLNRVKLNQRRLSYE